MAGSGVTGRSDVPQYVVQTQMTLGNVIAKPKLSAPLLLKPPFHFLHAILCEVVSATGFGRGLYAAEELNSKLVLVGRRVASRVRPRLQPSQLTRSPIFQSHPAPRARAAARTLHVRPRRAPRSTGRSGCSTWPRCSRW